MKAGFYVKFYGKEYFLVSSKVNITDKLAIEFLNRIQNHLDKFTNITEADVKFFKSKISKAYLRSLTTKSGYTFIDIFNDYFGGYGDENTVIFE